MLTRIIGATAITMMLAGSAFAQANSTIGNTNTTNGTSGMTRDAAPSSPAPANGAATMQQQGQVSNEQTGSISNGMSSGKPPANAASSTTCKTPASRDAASTSTAASAACP